MNRIGKISLQNQGSFTVRLEFVYNDGSGRKVHRKGTGDIAHGFANTADPGDYGVPDGALVSIFCNVLWICDKQGGETFLYQKGSGMIASYVITGTTLSNFLSFTGFSAANGIAVAHALPQDDAGFSEGQIIAVQNGPANPTLGQSGIWGPVGWNISMHLNPAGIRKSYLDARIFVFGVNIIGSRLDISHPVIAVNLTVKGVGVRAAIGIDFNAGEVYLKGSLNFGFQAKNFNLTILKF